MTDQSCHGSQVWLQCLWLEVQGMKHDWRIQLSFSWTFCFSNGVKTTPLFNISFCLKVIQVFLSLLLTISHLWKITHQTLFNPSTELIPTKPDADSRARKVPASFLSHLNAVTNAAIKRAQLTQTGFISVDLCRPWSGTLLESGGRGGCHAAGSARGQLWVNGPGGNQTKWIKGCSPAIDSQTLWAVRCANVPSFLIKSNWVRRGDWAGH